MNDDVYEYTHRGVARRWRIVRDEAPQKPERVGPILTLEDGCAGFVAGSDYSQLDAATRARAVKRFATDEHRWRRYLRAFHRASHVSVFTHDAVTYVVFDSPAYREEYRILPSEQAECVAGNKARWEAYVTGEVYCLTHEHQVSTQGGGSGWVEDGRLSGFYGRARARRMLMAAIPHSR